MRNPIELLVDQQANTPSREALIQHPYGRRILRSWFTTRLTVGILGVAMPFVLIIGDLFVLEGSTWTRGSLSAYYHSGVRDVFVGVLCIVGVFLISYRMSDWRHPDNWLSTIAGVAAVCVAFFPTNTGEGETPTPWQNELGESVVATVHLGAAAVFLLALAGVSYLFSRRDDNNGHHRYAALHRACAAIMLVACVGFAVLAILGVDKTGGFTVLLLTEVLSTLAFGVSWLFKGTELWKTLSETEHAERRGSDVPVTVAAAS